MKKLINWKQFFILLAACAVTTLMVLPYTLALTPVLPEEIPLWLIVCAAVTQTTILCAIAIFVGLILIPKIGFGMQNTKSLKLSVGLGVLSGILIIVCAIPFGAISIELLKAEAALPLWMGTLACFYGGIVEEVLFRLFLVSLLAWIAIRLKVPKNISVWVAIVLSAVLFGLGHLPITGGLTTITALVIARAIVLNGIGAIVFGWLYWKKGLKSAMIAHFSADVVLHIIVPFVAGFFV